MKKSKHTPEPLVLAEGFFLDKTYKNYEMMDESAKNWKYNCTYQLKPNALSGRHRILQLCSMQLGYAQRPGGMMNDSYSALDCISIAVIEECADKACFHRTKLHKGDIIFFDNSRPYNFVTNDKITFTVINIQHDISDLLQPALSRALDHSIKDTNGAFQTVVHDTWGCLTNTSEEKRDKQLCKKAEDKIMAVLKELLEAQTPTMSKLTKGEETALTIRDQVYAHMDGKINIASLAKQHNVSERTLQKSFQSLFGFTPTEFLRQMKLNLVYRDLKFADPKTEKVSSVAQKWGFIHMGRFSSYYTELFGENPSQTLKTPFKKENSMEGECVERKEEI